MISKDFNETGAYKQSLFTERRDSIAPKFDFGGNLAITRCHERDTWVFVDIQRLVSCIYHAQSGIYIMSHPAVLRDETKESNGHGCTWSFEMLPSECKYTASQRSTGIYPDRVPTISLPVEFEAYLSNVRLPTIFCLLVSTWGLKSISNRLLDILECP